MYGDVVLGMKPVNKEDIDPFEEIIEKVKEEKGVKLDNELEVEDLKELVKRFKVAVKEQTGQDFPTCAYEQLWGAICAVFRSWMNERAILYRKMEGIPAEWGTAVSVQAMVFGNMGDTSATGVCFSRDAGNGEDLFNGEYLINAQGEDVVAGIRTPQQITKIGSQRWAERAGISEEERVAKYPSMEEAMPEIYKELDALQTKLENHYRDMQDMEFTVQEGKLWFLQTRNGKRTGAAMVKIAMDLLRQGMIDEKTALERCEPNKLDELLHPVFDKKALKEAKVLTRGLPASPGAATGQIVFFADDAAKWAADGKKVVMVRIETSPEDLAGMAVAEGILTARGGMTSHAAVVARGMGKCCVSGAGAINVDYKTRTVEIEGITLKEGDFISLNGTTGEVYKGKVETKAAEVSGNFAALMDLCNKYTKLNVRTNADTPHDAEVARAFGASGIGLCRTEHMFFDAEKIVAMREMILSPDVEGRRKALAKLLPFQKADFKGIFKAMDGCPVNVRLLDPPLHEFVPHDAKGQEEMAKAMGVTVQEIKKRVESLCEHNPMLGHRGCRLGNTYPEITEMQTQAILGAAIELKKEGYDPHPEIMVPLTGILYEFEAQEKVIRDAAAALFEKEGMEIPFKVGTMIEIPRAALTANRIASRAEYFSFGTNDLTQMTFGYSRDDIASFLPVYLEKKILKVDPFQVLDQNGVGQLIEMAVDKGRSVRPDLKCGICGEHGGEPSSVKFCHKVGLNYVSCSLMNSVIMPLEESINGVENMMYMTSTATNAGSATIEVYFKQGTNPDMAAVNVQNRVTKAQGLLPAEVTRIGVSTQKRQTSFLQIDALVSTDGRFDKTFLGNYLDINVIPRIKRIEGVGDVMELGDTYSMRIWLNPERMAQYGLVPSDVTAVLGEQNIEAPTGSLGENSKNVFQYTMKYRGRLKSVEEFQNIVVRAQEDGSVLRLKDVAKVELGTLSYGFDSQMDGKPAVTFMIYQVAGSNATEVNERIAAELEKMKEELPTGMEFITMMSSNDFLFASIYNVVETLIVAIILVILVVYFFLQDFKSTLIPSISIIVSLIGTFACLTAAGFTINILTLFALVLAIGTVVDDAIVVVEAVQAKFDAGYTSSYQATKDAMGDVTMAVISCTCVFMAVFIPVTFMGGTSGIFYTQFGVTMATSVGLSMICALTLCPALCAMMMRPSDGNKSAKSFNGRVRAAYNASFNAVLGKYKKGVMFFIHHRWMVWAGTIASIILLGWLISNTKTGLVPQEDQGTIMANVAIAPGSTLEETGKVLDKVENILKNTPEVEHYARVAGYGFLAGQGTSYGMAIIRLKNWDERKGAEHVSDAVVARLNAQFAQIKEAQIFCFQPDRKSTRLNSSHTDISRMPSSA
mgnify:CR=1 FL=1